MLITIILISTDKPGLTPGGGGGGGYSQKICVRPAPQNPYPIYDQNLLFSLPYLWPDQKLYTLFMTWLFLLLALSSLHSRR